MTIRPENELGVENDDYGKGDKRSLFSKNVVFIFSNKTSDAKNCLVRCSGKIASNTISFLKRMASSQKLDGQDWVQS